MKIIGSYIVTYFFCLNFLVFNSYSQEKRALIIAVGNYNKNITLWNPISSANDIPLIKHALIEKGFGEQQIEVIQDSNATKNGIINAFDELIKNSKKSDQVYIHFSGHGQQIRDDNGDEADGYDEALIPYDAHKYFQKDIYEGQNHLRDDEFGYYLLKLRKKIGIKGSVLVTVDACHSGTSTKGFAKTRGTHIRFEGSNRLNIMSDPSSDVFEINYEREDLAPMVCIYGSSANELNYEFKLNDTTFVGSLSYAFSKVLLKSNSFTGYNALFDKIRVEMASIVPKQTPQYEGDLNRLIFGGEIMETPVYAMVESIIDSQMIWIDKGNLQGFYEGSTVAFFPIGSKNSDYINSLTSGRIIKSSFTSSVVKLDSLIDVPIIKSSWIFLSEQNFGDMVVSVQTDIKNKNLNRDIENELKKLPWIFHSEYPDIVIKDIKNAGDKSILELFSSDEQMLYSEEFNDENVGLIIKELIGRLVEFAQCKYLKKIETESLKHNCSLELSANNNKKINNIPDSKDSIIRLNYFYAGDTIQMKIQNGGLNGFYYTVLDIQPDYKVNILLPLKDVSPLNYYLNPGDLKLSKIMLYPPYGKEMFILISTERPIDFREVFSQNGIDKRSKIPESNPFQKMFNKVFSSYAKSKNPDADNIQVGSVEIKKVVFDIIPRK